MENIKFNSGESGLPITYIPIALPHTKFTIKELKEWWGLNENVTDAELKNGYTWNTNIIVEGSGNIATDHSTLSYNIYLKKLYAGDDLNKIDGEKTSDDDASATTADTRETISNVVKTFAEWVKEFCEHPVGKIIETFMDPLGHVLGDGAQWVANLIQSLPDDTYRDGIVLYTYKDLATDNEDGVDNTGISGDSTSTARTDNSSTSQIVFIGDSRTNALKDVNTNSSNVFICKDSEGYDWMMSTGFPEADSYAKQGTSFVILMGVNDLYKKADYVTAINSKAQEWISKGAKVFYASVGPVVDDPYATNAEIEDFNNTLKNGLISDITFIDLYAELTANGYQTVDGTHYTTETDKRILQFLEEQIKSGRNNNSNIKFI